MEKNSDKSEEKNSESTSENGGENMKVWLQENLRMLVSIVIVVVIAGGIYAYSKRTQAPMVKDETEVSQDSSEGKISVIGGDTAKNEEANTSEETTEAAPAADESAQNPSETVAPETKTQPAVTSQETESSFVEAAAPGDSVTTLARRALANYLEKNPDASLTPEHKIYIEDYLRRQVADGKISIGATREFSKDMIANAISKSKNLNEKQLKNLQKYAQRVPGLN